MSFDNDNHARPPIQVLVTSCAAFGDPDPRCAWLHGYALLTLRPTDTEVRVAGEVLTGQRYADDQPIIDALEASLDPGAVLAGNDLTDIVSRLGRLPIDSRDQRLSLALLAKLESMIGGHCPLDLSLTSEGQLLVAIKAIEHGLTFCEMDDGEGADIHLGGSPDNLNPVYLAAQLGDRAGAIALAIGELYLEPALRPSLLENWQQWRTQLHRRWPAGPESEDSEPAF